MFTLSPTHIKYATFFLLFISYFQDSYAGVICQKKNNFSHLLQNPESTMVSDYSEIASSIKRVGNGTTKPVENKSASLFKNLNQTITGTIGQECLKNKDIKDSELMSRQYSNNIWYKVR